MGTNFGQTPVGKPDVGPSWTAQPGLYPIAPADDSWNLNELASNEWLGFHMQSASGHGVGRAGASGTADTMGGAIDTSAAAIDEFMRSFEEVTRNGTGYHGPRP